MKKLFYILLIFFFSAISGFGQSRQLWVAEADNSFSKSDYNKALIYYEKAMSDSVGLTTEVLPYEITLSNQKIDKRQRPFGDRQILLKDYLSHQIAMCYHFTANYKKAVPQFKQTSAIAAYPTDMYYYGNALMKEGYHEKAITAFDAYLNSENQIEEFSEKSRLGISGCKMALDSEKKMNVNVALADTNIFNKGTSSFAPMFWGNNQKLIFTSAQQGGVIFDPLKEKSALLCDLYWTESVDDKWQQPHNFGRPLNSAQHDASGCFNNNNLIFYTRWSDRNPIEKKIHAARMLDLKFYEVYVLDSLVNYPGYISINPFVSEDGQTLYFSSNRPGGKGGLDIWKIAINANGEIQGDAVNLGEPVNTVADEMSPFYHSSSSTLFFSSNGHSSIGGLDIFKSAFDEDNEQYKKVINLGSPINSNKDDAYLVWDKDIQKGFFASDRIDCPTNHCYKIYEVSNSTIEITMEGFIFDSETDNVLSDAEITFKDIRYKTAPLKVKTDEKGFFSITLPHGMEFFIKAKHAGYFADAANADLRKITESTVIQQDFYLREISENPIEIAGIEYDYDKATLRPKSKEVLDNIVEQFLLNDNLVIEIISNTDVRGDEDYNLRLSQARAQSVVDYLVKNNIKRDRLVPIGKGELNPLVKNAQTEEEHQRNRRTEFRIVGENYLLESK